MSNLSMSADEIRRRYRAGTSISILADLNGCGQSLISTIVGEEERPKKEKKAATSRHRVDYTRARELYDAGKNDVQIADALGTTGPSIMKWRQRENLPSKVSRAEAGRRAGKARVAKRRAATENKEIAAAVQPMFDAMKKEPVESGPLSDIEQSKKALKIGAKRLETIERTGINAPITSDEEQEKVINDGVIQNEVVPSIALREYARKLQELLHKPLIDLEPRDEWECRRKIDLARAISRRVGRREPLPEEWIEEWNERTAR